MEFGTKSSKGGGSTASRRSGAGMTHRDRRARIKVGDGTKVLGGRPNYELEEAFPCVASFYEDLPDGDVGLADFEALAVERLKVLRAVEKVGQLGVNKYSKEWVTKMDEELGNVKGDLRGYSFAGMSNRNNRDHLLARERDHFSHYILRLAYCHQEEKRRWMVQQEVDLFRYRCQRMLDLRDLIDAYQLSYATVPEEEVAGCRAELEGLAFNKAKTFYKVHFTEALDLVRGRKVVMKGGFCYVPDTEMVTLVSWLFKSNLTQALLFTNKMLPGLNEDERMGAVLKDLDTRYTGADYSAKEGEGPAVTPEMIRPLSQKHFPMCMRAMQNTLNATHHLKYKARLQYGLFLKGIGLSMEDSIRFFRQEFTQAHIDGDKFDKEYVYGIRYNYGREGRKTNWAPWDCMRAIMGAVGPGENHGCPYRHYDPDALRTLLAAAGLEGTDLNEVVQLAKDGHYQKACSAEYKASHKGLEISTGMVNHPNQYYTESVNGGGSSANTGSNSKVKRERANVYGKDEDDDFMMELAAQAEAKSS